MKKQRESKVHESTFRLNAFATLGCLWVLLTNPLGLAAQDAPIDLEWARSYFNTFAQIGDSAAGGLWGVPLYGPILLVDRRTRFVVANHADSLGLLTESSGIWTGTLPAEQNIANTAVEWSGLRWSMVIWPLPADVYQRQKLVFHELFHRIQPELGLSLGDPTNAHLNTMEGRIWIRLEWRALSASLLRAGAERKEALADALLFRAQRHRLFPMALNEERMLELNEGLAEYTGLRMSGLPQWAIADRAALRLADGDGSSGFSRSFAYASGPAYGILLDEAEVEWRSTISDSSSLPCMVGEAYGIVLETEGDPLERALVYDGQRVVQEENHRAEEAAAREAQLIVAFVEGPTITLPVTSGFRYSFDPNQAVPLTDLGTVYETARVTAAWGILTVESGGVLMLRGGGGIQGVRVPVDPDAPDFPSASPGWTLELNDGWTVELHETGSNWRVVQEGN